jgi:hypothetical protein
MRNHAQRAARTWKRPAGEDISYGLAIDFVGGGETRHAQAGAVVLVTDLAGEIGVKALACGW